MLRPRVAFVLVLFVAGCTVQAAPAPARPTAEMPTAADEQVLRRWAHWRDSALAGTANPELPQRGYCAPDPASDLWFLDAPSVPGPEQRWDCALPAGRALVVASTVVTSADQALCDRGLKTLLPIEGEARVDGEPVVLRWAGIPDAATPASVPMCSEALWGTTEPLAAGRHTIVLRNADDVSTTTAIVDVTAR